MDIGLIFTAAGFAKSLAEFTGILDGLDAKVDRLVQSELNAGLRMLDHAALTSTEEVSLLREARTCFTKAVGLERGLRRAIAFLGLALCHHCLDDAGNRDRALEELLDINPVTSLHLATAAGMNHLGGRNFNWLASVKPQALNPLEYLRLVFSKAARQQYHRKLVLDALAMNREATSVRRLQEAVASLIGKPIPWLAALQIS